MPITYMKTSNKPPGQQKAPQPIEAAGEVADSLSPDLKEHLYDLIEAYLKIVPDPEDVQIHALAAALRVSPEVFEQFLYEILSRIVNAGQSLEASDSIGDLASQDGEPDLEQAFGEKDPMKKASESDGALDVEQIEENLKDPYEHQ